MRLTLTGCLNEFTIFARNSIIQEMNYLNLLSLIPLLALALSSCGSRHKQSSPQDFDKEVYAPRYATQFDIKGSDGNQSVIISVRNPWQDADSVTFQLFIARDGEAIPQGFDGQVLRGDARRIVTMSSTHIAMLDAVDAVDRVVGVSGLDYISNSSIQQRRDTIGDVGYEGNINYEMLLSLNPDIVLLYGVSAASSMQRKLEELGIPYMYICDYLEESPVGKAEWLVAVAEIVGKRDEGMDFFSHIPVQYDSLRNMVKETITRRPSVMLNTPYGDSWFMPPSRSYMVRLIEDAGGEYIYKDNVTASSLPIDLEEAYRLTSQADVWINVGNADTLDDVKALCPKFTDTQCFLDGNIFNNNLNRTQSGGNDFYESAVVRPDIVLRDLIKIFHPQLVPDDFVYYRQLTDN